MYMSFKARAAGLDLTADETVSLAAGSGFRGVDLLVRDLVEAGTDLRTLRRRMDDLGLPGGAFPLPVHWREGAKEFAHDLALLPRYAAAAEALGRRRTGTWVMPETREPGHGGDSGVLKETVALHVERLGRIARVLDAAGIRLGLEVIGVASSRTGRGRPFVHPMTDLGRVLGGVWSEAPNLGLVVDAFHLYAARESIEAGLAWGVERVVWVHVADLPASAAANREVIRDSDRGLPGENGALV